MDEIAAALEGQYRIVRELGGGMSRVFVAVEHGLGREVVVKVLPPEMAAGASTDRFRREMALVARLQHPHLVPILRAEARGAVHYYVMPLIEGESLRARLARDGALPIAEVARILRDVAGALQYAHAHGVVHRDIKPDNVLLTSGHAMVTDFGVAKALDVSAADGGSTLTTAGMALGTPAYMAPEQAAADPHVDHRADLYALGVMAYEMLAGQPPFIAPTAQALIAAHFTREPDSLRRDRPSVPEELDALVLRCLAKRPGDRFQQAAELVPILDRIAHPSGMFPVAVPGSPGTTNAIPATTATDPGGGWKAPAVFAAGAVAFVAAAVALREYLGLPDWLVVAVSVLLMVLLPAWLLLRARRRSGATRKALSTRALVVNGALAIATLALVSGAWASLRALGVGPFATLMSKGTIAERDRILVAEFTNATPDSTLGTALREALTIDLSQSRSVRLVSPTELQGALTRMQRAQATPLTPDVAREVAAREGVKVVVAGEIKPFASGYALSARLLDPQGTTLYATRATANDAGTILTALEQISRDIREQLGESLRSIRATAPLAQVTTTSLEALRLYSRAEESKRLGLDEDRLALLRQAVALDSTFAMAWRAIYAELVNSRGDEAAVYDAVDHAYRYHDRLPQREALQTEVLMALRADDAARAVDLSRRILASWPDDLQAKNQEGLYLRALGRYAESEAAFAPLIESGKATASMYHNMVTSQVAQSRFREAEHTLALMRERLPQAPIRLQAEYYLASGQYAFARALAYADSLTGLSVGSRYWGYLYRVETEALRGQLRAADRTLRNLAQAQREQQNPYGVLNELLSYARIDFQLRSDTGATRRRIAAALAAVPFDSLPVTARPWGDLARLHAMIGDSLEARRVIAQYDRTVPAALHVGSGAMHRARAQLALLERKPADALAHVRRSENCGGCRSDLLGQAFEALGQTDSAIVAYERALQPAVYGSEFRNWRPGVVPRAMFRLGQLYEQTGQRALARDRYAQLVDLWEHADPELQPARAAARDRLRALASER